MSEVHESIMQGLHEALAHARGELQTGAVEHTMSIASIPEYTPSEIKQIRLNANMTQAMFAACMGVSKKAIEGWEGGRSHPSGIARRMLALFECDPSFADNTHIIQR